MFKACLYTTLLHACMLMQEKGNSNLCECNLKQDVRVLVLFGLTLFNFFFLFSFLRRKYYFVHVRAEDSVSK